MGSGKKGKILYMDDYPDTLDTVKEILEAEGFQVTVTGTSAEFIAALKKTDYDLILLDMMMPELSGWDLFNKITKHDGKYRGKVVFFSVLETSPEKMDLFRKVGVVDYIQKPFDKDQLVKKVKKIVGVD